MMKDQRAAAISVLRTGAAAIILGGLWGAGPALACRDDKCTPGPGDIRPITNLPLIIGGYGSIRVFDGPTTPANVFPPFPDYTGRLTVALGDLNGDGIADIVTAPGAGPSRVRVFDGADLYRGAPPAPILEFPPLDPDASNGVFVAAGDLGSGPTIVVGSGTGAATVVVVDAAGSVVTTFQPFLPGFTGGVRVAIGGGDGNGPANIVAGSGPGMSGTVVVFNGQTTAPIATFQPFGPGFTSGVTVATGVFESVPALVVGQGANGGLVKIYKLDGLRELASFHPFGPGHVGGVNVGAGQFLAARAIFAGDASGSGVVVFTATVTGISDDSGPAASLSASAGPRPLASFVPFDGAEGVFPAGISLATGSPALVPEPASWALLIAGFGLVGSALRRRRAFAPA